MGLILTEGALGKFEHWCSPDEIRRTRMLTFCLGLASSVSMQGTEYPNVPSLYTREHADGWRKVVDAVHKEGALIFCQLVSGIASE